MLICMFFDQSDNEMYIRFIFFQPEYNTLLNNTFMILKHNEELLLFCVCLLGAYNIKVSTCTFLDS